MYTIKVKYWSDHSKWHSANQRSSYKDAMAFWRKQCREHRNADVVLYDAHGRVIKSKADAWEEEYQIAKRAMEATIKQRPIG